ncbi:hypothetical protein BASA81_004863 [Batrachochytrium salamandrivorans]|nr:hypothetical protein BASA81_004863 [Batrachochytrium salamandrivorans]
MSNMDPYDFDGLFHDEVPASSTAPSSTTTTSSSQQQLANNAEIAKRVKVMADASHSMLRSVALVAQQDISTILLFSQADTPQAIVKMLQANRTDLVVVRSALKAFYLIMDSNQVQMFAFGRDVADIFVFALDVDPESATRSIFVSCLHNEANRSDLWQAGLVQKFKELLCNFPPEAIRYACETMSIFAREGSKARIMWEAGLADLAIRSLWENKNQMHVPYSVCLLLSRFTFHQANLYNMRLNGAEAVILEAMRENSSDVDSLMAAFAALFWMWDGGCARCLCPDGASVCGCFQTRACRVFLDVLRKNHAKSQVVKLCLDTFARLAPCIKDTMLAGPVCAGLIPMLRLVSPMGGADSVFIILETLVPFLNDDMVRQALEAVNLWLQQEQQGNSPPPPSHILICARHAILMLQRDMGTTRYCEMCRQKEVNQVLRDCGHACLCEVCAHIVFIRPYRVCPYPSCRKKITKQPLKFYPSGKLKLPGAGATTATTAASPAAAAAAAALSSSLEENDLCAVCHDSPISQVFEECGHACTCKRCGEQIVQTSRNCSICRRHIVQMTGFSYPWIGRSGGGGIVNTLQGATSFMF